MSIAFEHTYGRLPNRFFAKVRPTPVAKPALLAVNKQLAEHLGVTEEQLVSPEGIEALAGNRLFDRSEPIALAYAGHQFGGFVPQLGDGRAILLGELVGRDGRRYDVQLKGAGPTPFSRGGDGRAAIGPVLREYVVSEAMAALGIATTRSLAAVTTGEIVYRENRLPGAVLTRVASSHIRIGTFQYFAVRNDGEAIRLLVDYALARHYPESPKDQVPALALLDAVISAQANLVAHWMSVGFIHGVMNTDNMSISGETIDYGPCAFMDSHHPLRTFSSIDRNGRYAFGNQPKIALWNLSRFAETLLPIVDDNEERAVEVLTKRLETYPEKFESAYAARIRRKLGLSDEKDDDIELAQALFDRMTESRVDFTNCFRRLTESVTSGKDDSVAELFEEPERYLKWAGDWRKRMAQENVSVAEREQMMRHANPAFIPRNHRIEEMITAATQGDMKPFERLCRVLARPYDDQPQDAELAEAPGEEQWKYRTFCGT